MVITVGKDPLIIDQGGRFGKTDDICVKLSLFLEGGINHPDNGENTGQRKDPKDQVHEKSADYPFAFAV